MPKETVGEIPEFTGETPPEEIQEPEEVKKAGTEEPSEIPEEKVPEEEKVTPAELPAEEKPPEKGEITGEEIEELRKQIEGLSDEREKLLAEIRELRGQRRDIKTEELKKVEEKIDELKEVYPEDAILVEKIARAKGFLTKTEVQQMLYNQVKQEELNKFLEKYPQYKPDNDPNDINWNTLQKELSYYRLPENPHLINTVLEKAHRAISRPSSGRETAKEKRLETARIGGGGIQRPPSRTTLTPRHRQELERGGWSEEEIKKIEENLPEE